MVQILNSQIFIESHITNKYYSLNNYLKVIHTHKY